MSDTGLGLSVTDICGVTEAAAIAAATWVGRGDEKAADRAAVDAMRAALNRLAISGRVVIGEGERDKAPMLYIGEEVGTGIGPRIDIALDPLEGTTIAAVAAPGSLAVLALAASGGFLNAPDVYMDKIAVGPRIAPGTVDLDASPAENLRALANELNKPVSEVTACILDRPRHRELIAAVRAAGARVKLIGDGDIAAVIALTDSHPTVDVYMGSGGAPEGVLAAAALLCNGGWIQGRLLFRDEAEKNRAARWGVTDLQRKYQLSDLARGDVVFAASGVTDGPLLRGVRVRPGKVGVSSLIMSSRDGVRRRIDMLRRDAGAGR